MRVLTAENGRAGQPANQKGNEIKISFSDTMYSIHIIFSLLWLSCHVKHSAVVGGASKLLIDHIIPLYLTAMLALSSLGSYIFTVLQIYMHRVCLLSLEFLFPLEHGNHTGFNTRNPRLFNTIWWDNMG